MFNGTMLVTLPLRNGYRCVGLY